MQSTTQNAIRKLGFVIVFSCTIVASLAQAGPREQAKRIHDRLTGVPPSAAVLDSMADKIANNDAVGAAFEAMDNSAFYNTTVREFATPWTNREQTVFADFNDTVATVVGMIRDEIPFDQVLYEDIIYVGTPAATAVAYSHSNNDHYIDLELNRVDLSDPANLEMQLQSALPNTPIGAGETAGIMTTRGFSQAFLVAGTNRAAVRFALLNHLCMDQEDFRDLTAHPDRVRGDVTRSPGGDSSVFLTDCLTCHAGLDGLAGAFAYYDFDEDLQQLVYTDGAVQPKYHRDGDVFRFGFQTEDDSWINYWREGPNQFVGWNAPGSGAGTGAKTLGMEMAQTRQFAECQVKRAFEKVCYRSPNGTADEQAVETIATNFEASNRNMKQVFAETAVHCMGQ